MNTKESNILILNFMEVETIEAAMMGYKSLSYHNDWNWLLPVVKKINNTKFNELVVYVYIKIDGTHACTYSQIRTNEFNAHWQLIEYIQDAEIESVYKIVVATIKEMNKHKKEVV